MFNVRVLRISRLASLVVGCAASGRGYAEGVVVIGPSGADGVFLLFVVMIVLALVSLKRKRPPSRDSLKRKSSTLESSSRHSDDSLGQCPNCRATISVKSVKCQHCGADFGDGAEWKVERL